MNIKRAVVKLLKEYVIQEKIKDDFQVLPTTKQEAEPFVLKHYLEKFPTGIKRIYGIYRRGETGREIVGVIIYGVPFMTAAKFLEPEVKLNETLELKRLFIDDLGIKNLESFVIGQSLKLLKRDEPQVKVVITFADDKQGHKGIIYQATNAIYLGSGGGKHKYIYILRGDINAIKNRVQQLVKQYPKGIQEYYNYTDIGHEGKPGDYIWYWWNGGEVFKSVPARDKTHSYMKADFQGRYDSRKRTASIIDLGSYTGDDDSTDMEKVPLNLLKRLKFEYGDDTVVKPFYQ